MDRPADAADPAPADPVTADTVPAADRWWATAVVYQLYVRSFADADGDGIGDLEGIRGRLDHLARLGVDAVWLNPCYPSPQRDHGYDVSDYFDIDPAYGDLATFDALVADARERGIKVLMDVVPNHCSSDHPWFQAALAAGPGSPERERFWFRDGRGPDGAEPPNDWQAIFGGPAWTRVTEPDGSPGQWYLGVFTPHQPDLCWLHPDVGQMFDDMLRFWFDRGVEGFRADAVSFLGKADGLPDYGKPSRFGNGNPLFEHQPAGHAAWRRWRRTITDYNDQHPGRDVFAIAEAYTHGRADIFARYVNPEQFHQGFSFDLLLEPWHAEEYRRAISDVVEGILSQGIPPAWTLNNHDCERSVTRFGRPEATQPRDITEGNLVYADSAVDVALGRRRALAAMLLTMALPGSVYVYMGEELGLPEVIDLPDEVREDPLFHLTDGERRGRDGCRVPVPWTADPAGNHGFSGDGPAGDPWLPQPEWWGEFAAEAQGWFIDAYAGAIADRRSLFGTDLSFRWADLGADPGDLVAFHRGDALVVTNLGGEPATLPAALVEGLEVRRTSADPGATDPASADPADPAVVPADTTVWLAPPT